MSEILPYLIGQSVGGSGAVSSVFGRTGAVSAQSGDFSTTLVSNTSSVTGATVTAALDKLAGDLTAVGAGISDWKQSVKTRTDTPASNPTSGDRYLVGDAPTGTWVGHANAIAQWDGAAWQYTTPTAGDAVNTEDTGHAWVYSGQSSAWNDQGATTVAPVTSVFGRTGTVSVQAGDYTASQVTNVPAGGIAANTVQNALNELDTEKAIVARQVISGAGLTGGGDLSADRTLAVGAGTGITVNVDDVALADMAQSTIKGRASGAGTGAPTDLSATQVRTILNVADGSTAAGATGDAYATSHEADTTAHAASSIVNTPAGNIAATDVQAAINELDSEKAASGHNHDSTYAARATQIATQHSLSGGGDLSATRTLALVGDVASPGANKVYGTNGAGDRVWLDVGGTGAADALASGTLTYNNATTSYTEVRASSVLAEKYDAVGTQVTLEFSGTLNNSSTASRAARFELRINGTLVATAVSVNSTTATNKALQLTWETWRYASGIAGRWAIVCGATVQTGTCTNFPVAMSGTLTLTVNGSVSATSGSVDVSYYSIDRSGTVSGSGHDSLLFPSIAAMRAAGTAPSNNALAELLGATTVNDGGQARYTWSATSTAADDGANVIAITGVTTGRFHKLTVPTHTHVSTDAGNTLTSGPKFWVGTSDAFSNIRLKDFASTIYFVGGGYVIAPSMTLDLTRGLPDLFTITRASPQVVVKSDGTLLSAANDAFATHHAWNGQTWAPLGYLAEKGSTQQIAAPLDFADTAAVDHLGLTYSANATTAPDGTATADRFTETAANTQHSVVIRSAQSFSANKMVVYSVYVKKESGGRDFFDIRLNWRNGGPWYANVIVDCSGATPTISGLNWSGAKIVPLANGWWRLEAGWYSDVTDATTMEMTITPMPSAESGLSFAGDAGKSFSVWGAQIDGTAAGLVAGSSLMTGSSRSTSLLSGPISTIVPTSITVSGRVPGAPGFGRDSGIDNLNSVDQFLCAFSGPGSSNALIEVYRQYDDQRLVVSIAGGAKVDLGVVASGADFALTTPLVNAPVVDFVHVGTDALGEKHWNGTIKEITLS